MIARILLTLLLAAALNCRAESALVAAAANLTHPLTLIAEQFERETGMQLKLSFGSSGNIAHQIMQGAPYELFLSADRKYSDLVLEDGHAMPPAVIFARGRAVFFVPGNSPLHESVDFEDLKRQLQLGNYSRLAIPNPEFAPFGVAATQALQAAGVWAIARQRLLLAENAAQAVQFTVSGNVDLGIIPYSYVVDPEVASQGRYFEIPEDWHEPLEQTAVLLTGAGAVAKQFFVYLRQPAASAVLQRYGYAIPD